MQPPVDDDDDDDVVVVDATPAKEADKRKHVRRLCRCITHSLTLVDQVSQTLGPVNDDVQEVIETPGQEMSLRKKVRSPRESSSAVH